MITILMATYNGERHIKEQMESILNQTVQELYLIVQDDLSSDQTFSIVREYANKYPNKIRCIQNEFPTGSAKGNFFLMLNNLKRKNVTRSATHLFEAVEQKNSKEKMKESEFFIFADQDDVWKENKLEKMQEHLKKMEEKYGRKMPLLVYADLEVVDVNLRQIHPSMQRMMGHKTEAKSLSRLLVENDVTGNSLMFNQALLDIYFEPMNSPMHDWYLALLAKVYGKVEFLDETLTLYRQHETNTLGAKKLSALQALLGKLQRKEKEKTRIQVNYKEMFAQVTSIVEHSEQIEKILQKPTENKSDLQVINVDNLDHRYRVLSEFLSLQKRSRIGKILCIFRNRFFKSRILMSLGQLFSI